MRCETRIAETCIQCDSANEDQKDCGFVKNSENLMVCSATLGCFTQLYTSEILLKIMNFQLNENYFTENDTETAYPGWYTRRGCIESSTSSTCDGCTLCDENNCNGDVVPADRNKCLKCINGDCSQAKSEYCQVYRPDKKDCVTLFDEGKHKLVKRLILCEYSPENLTSKTMEIINYIIISLYFNYPVQTFI